MVGEGLLCGDATTARLVLCVDVGRIARRPLEITRAWRHVRIDSISVPLTVRGSSGMSLSQEAVNPVEIRNAGSKVPWERTPILGLQGKRNTCGLVRAMKRPSLCLRAQLCDYHRIRDKQVPACA